MVMLVAYCNGWCSGCLTLNEGTGWRLTKSQLHGELADWWLRIDVWWYTYCHHEWLFGYGFIQLTILRCLAELQLGFRAIWLWFNSSSHQNSCKNWPSSTDYLLFMQIVRESWGWWVDGWNMIDQKLITCHQKGDDWCLHMYPFAINVSMLSVMNVECFWLYLFLVWWLWKVIMNGQFTIRQPRLICFCFICVALVAISSQLRWGGTQQDSGAHHCDDGQRPCRQDRALQPRHGRECHEPGCKANDGWRCPSRQSASPRRFSARPIGKDHRVRWREGPHSCSCRERQPGAKKTVTRGIEICSRIVSIASQQ